MRCLQPAATSFTRLLSFLSCSGCRRELIHEPLRAPSFQTGHRVRPMRTFSTTATLLAPPRTVKKTKRAVRDARKRKHRLRRHLTPSQRTALWELRQENEAFELQMASIAKEEVTEHVIRGLPTYTEEYFEHIYQALLSSSEYTAEAKLLSAPDAPQSSDLTGHRGARLVTGLYKRLILNEPSPSAPAAVSPQGAPSEFSATPSILDTPVATTLAIQYNLVVDHLKGFIQEATASNGSSLPGSKPPIRLGLVSTAEWSALLAASVNARDVTSVAVIFDLMRRAGEPIKDSLRNQVMNSFVVQGRVEDVKHLTAAFNQGVPPAERISDDFAVNAHLHAGELSEAILLIHTLEEQNTPASMDAYASIIEALLARRGIGSAQDRALAWDFFAHMRYVAHPQPTAHLFGLMIKACAEGPEPEPERAMDLFTEMTVDNRIPPTTEAYNGVIMTLAKSKRTAHDAFRMLQQMIVAFRDDPSSGLQPDRQTYCALFESAKRLGDLPRARWLLAELLKGAEDGGAQPDEEIMSHVFQTYAAYRPPFRRSEVVVNVKQASTAKPGPERMQPPVSSAVVETPETHSFTPVLPQTHAEVVREADSLLERIFTETSRLAAATNGSRPLFHNVEVNARLLNSYQSVHYAHSPLQTAMDEYQRLHAMSPVPVNAWTFMGALERCAYAKTQERDVALVFARRAWVQWLTWLSQHSQGLLARGISGFALDSPSGRRLPGSAAARVAERIWTAMIRVVTLAGELDEALSLVRVFMKRFPPVTVRTAITPPSKVISSFNPVIRTKFAPETQDVDDAVPPVLLFRDLELLHHRLVAADRMRDVGYVKFVCRAYAGSLSTRRREFLTTAGGTSVKVSLLPSPQSVGLKRATA